MRNLLLALFASLTLAAPSFAQSVTFAWDLHEQAADLQGFNLYASKTSPVCTSPDLPPTGATLLANFPGGTTTTGTVTFPKPGKQNVVATAVALDGLESTCSNEVQVNIRPKPPKNLVSTVKTVLTSPARGVIKLANAFKSKKNLRVTKIV